MDHRKYGKTYYIRADKGDEIISCIIDVCKQNDIKSAIFSGIGGCDQAQIQTFDPEAKAFETRTLNGMLELASLTGNVIRDDNGGLCFHAHAVLAYKENDRHLVAAGHIKSLRVLYTAEIELRPVEGGTINKRFDPETGTGFWNFNSNG